MKINQSVMPVVAATILVFLSYFQSFQHFGFYEDDIYFTALSFNLTDWDQVFDRISQYFQTWPLGRPLGHSFNVLLPFLTVKISPTVQTQYILGFFILVTSGVLIFWISRHFYETQTAAFIGILTFFLWPSDTNRAFLHHLQGTYISLLFFLVSFLFFIKKRDLLSLFFLTGSLVTYESLFPIAILFPLFRKKDFSNFIEFLKQSRSYLISYTCIFGGYLFLRRHFGETRLSQMDGHSEIFPLRVLKSMLSGLKTQISSFEMQFKVLDFDILRTFLVVGILFFLIYLSCKADLKKSIGLSKNFKMNLFISFGFLLLSYAGFALSKDRYPPVSTFGRMNSVHFGGLVGLSLLFAGLTELFIIQIRKKRTQLAMVAGVSLVAIIFGISFQIGRGVQHDFRMANKLMRERFWTALTKVEPFEGSQVILAVVKDMVPLTHVRSDSWTDSILIDRVFTDVEYQKVRIYFLMPNWKEQFNYLETKEGMSWYKPGDVNPARTETYKAREFQIIEIQDSNLLDLPDTASLGRFMKMINSSDITRYGRFLLGQSEEGR